MIVDKRYGISADSCEFSRARETTLDKIHLIYGNNCIASDTRAGYAPRCVYLTSIARKDGKEKRRHAREEFAARFAHRQAARQVIYPPRDASDAGAIIGVDDDRRPSLALNIPDASGQKSRAACLCAAIYNRLVLPRLLSGYFTAESHSAGAGERGGGGGGGGDEFKSSREKQRQEIARKWPGRGGRAGGMVTLSTLARPAPLRSL